MNLLNHQTDCLKLVNLVVFQLEITKHSAVVSDNIESVVSDNMNNISKCAIIRYLGLNGLTTKKIEEVMVVTLEENAPSYSMVKK